MRFNDEKEYLTDRLRSSLLLGVCKGIKRDARVRCPYISCGAGLYTTRYNFCLPFILTIVIKVKLYLWLNRFISTKYIEMSYRETGGNT